MDSVHAEDVKKSVRKYLIVFVSLMALTVVTVAISALHLSVVAAVTLALIVAAVKASLVAGYFMHLLSEKKVIYATLILTAIFFIFLMFLPISTDMDSLRLVK